MDRLLVDPLLLIHSGRLLVVEHFWLVERLGLPLGLLFQLEEWLDWHGTVFNLVGNRIISCIIKSPM
jgi:hypothetical protein